MPSNSRAKTNKAQLPDSFRPLFWSYRFDQLEPTKDARTIVIQLINYGSLRHWRWLVRRYGTTEIKHVLESIPATEIRPRTRVLASLLFSIPTWRYAYRDAH
jgi:hypothetical protein